MDSVIPTTTVEVEEKERLTADSKESPLRDNIVNDQDIISPANDGNRDDKSQDETSELTGNGCDQQTHEISVGEQMQMMCDLYGFKQDTYWDSYREDQKDALRNKLSLIVSHEFVTEKNLVRSITEHFPSGLGCGYP